MIINMYGALFYGYDCSTTALYLYFDDVIASLTQIFINTQKQKRKFICMRNKRERVLVNQMRCNLIFYVPFSFFNTLLQSDQSDLNRRIYEYECTFSS